MNTRSVCHRPPGQARALDGQEEAGQGATSGGGCDAASLRSWVERLEALAHPTRPRIPAMLAERKRCACHPAAVFDQAFSTVSAHLGRPEALGSRRRAERRPVGAILFAVRRPWAAGCVAWFVATAPAEPAGGDGPGPLFETSNNGAVAAGLGRPELAPGGPASGALAFGFFLLPAALTPLRSRSVSTAAARTPRWGSCGLLQLPRQWASRSAGVVFWFPGVCRGWVFDTSSTAKRNVWAYRASFATWAMGE